MSERLLARPDTSRFPAPCDRWCFALPAGATVGRIYAAGGDYPIQWNEFRAWGPTCARFDHQPSPRRVHPTRRVSYVAPVVLDRRGDIYPVLKTCLAECFTNRRIVETKRDDPYYCLFRIARPLKLLDLSDTDWVSWAGANTAIASGPHGAARTWSRAIYRTYTDIDGMMYASSNTAAGRAIVLWERAEDAVPTYPDFNEPLSHIGLKPAVETFAFELGLDLD